MPRRNWNKVFVTGGTSFVGLRVVAALVDAGADVTIVVRPENEGKLGALRRHVRLVTGDVWNSASLKGRSRGHGVVIHLVGSVHAQPERGLTFQQLNLVSARNVVGMAVGDGVPYVVLLSAAHTPPGVSREYLRSKRDAEEYLRNSGLRWAIVRAPILFDRTQRGGTFFALLSWFGSLPLLRVFTGWRTPMRVETAGQGIAEVALQEDFPQDLMLYAKHLRRLGRVKKPKRTRIRLRRSPRQHAPPAYSPDDEAPFGWLPGQIPGDDD